MSKRIDLKRHERDCAVCRHRDRGAIEQAFTTWESPARISREYHLAIRSIYRHAQALDLYSQRDKAIRRALGRIIEKGMNLRRVSPAVVVSACAAFARINATGIWVNHCESIDLNALFEKMSNEELEKYAQDGKLPNWFSATVGGTAIPSAESEA